MPGRHAAETTTTQVLHPYRATARSVFQAVVALCAAAPLIYTAATQQDAAAATGAAATVLAVTGAVTRVMALPVVEELLQRYLPFLAAQPRG